MEGVRWSGGLWDCTCHPNSSWAHPTTLFLWTRKCISICTNEREKQDREIETFIITIYNLLIKKSKTNNNQTNSKQRGEEKIGKTKTTF